MGSCSDIIQVVIGSPDLKANHAIRQHVDIVSENQKYNKYAYRFMVLLCYLPLVFMCFCMLHHIGFEPPFW